MQNWHAFCQRCFMRLPYEMRKELRHRHALPVAIERAAAWLDADALEQAAKAARMSEWK